VITLAIDASTYVGTVAVIRDGDVLAAGEAAMRGRESEALMPTVASTLSEAGCVVRELGRIVSGAGPGSFTSLRIAASIAKGLALGIGCPLFAVSSLALLLDERDAPGRYIAVLDALRDDAYVWAYSLDGKGSVDPILSERLVRQSELPPLAVSLNAITVGPRQSVDRAPHARAAAALERLIQQEMVDPKTWEPRYGRKAEAQTRWEAAHQRSLPVSGTTQ
jgi:tRNA threonylcarbamoyladenosine biosynthesis protein TsaB